MPEVIAADNSAKEQKPPFYDPERYGFVASILDKCGLDDPEGQAAAKAGFARWRRGRQMRVFDTDDVNPYGPALVQLTFEGHDEDVHIQNFKVITTDARGRIRQLHTQLTQPHQDEAGKPNRLFADHDLADLAPALREEIEPEIERRSNDRRAEEFENTPVSLSAFTRGRHAAVNTGGGAQRAIGQYKSTVLDNQPGHEIEEKKLNRAVFMMDAVVQKREKMRVNRHLQDFIGRLDPEVVRRMRSAAQPDVKSYNWLAGDGEPERGPRRQQAFDAYPLFFRTMKESSRITNTIDKGEPLAPMLAKAASVRESTVRALGGTTWQRAGREAYIDQRGTSAMLEITPAEYRPRTGTEWRQWFPAARGASTVAENITRNIRGKKFSFDRGGEPEDQNVIDSNKLATQFMVQIKDRQAEYGARLSSGHGSSGAIDDYLSGLKRHVILPELKKDIEDTARARLAAHLESSSQPSDVPREDFDYGIASAVQRECFSPEHTRDFNIWLARNRTLPQLVQSSEYWHARERGFRAQVADSDADVLSWPALNRGGEEITASNGAVITPLTDSRALEREGDEMEHCVGGYSRATSRGESHLFHIRPPEGGKGSTLELEEVALENGRRGVALVQNQGPENKPPAPSTTAAAKWMVREINEERIAVDWNELDREHKKFRDEESRGGDFAERFRQYCDYNVDDSDRRDKAFAFYAPTLPKRVARRDPGALLDDIGIDREASIQHVVENAARHIKNARSNREREARRQSTPDASERDVVADRGGQPMVVAEAANTFGDAPYEQRNDNAHLHRQLRRIEDRLEDGGHRAREPRIAPRDQERPA